MWCHQLLQGRMEMEILPGIHRIESDLGERFKCQYLLVSTPEEVIVPYLEGIGGDSPVDMGLRGGETLRLGPDFSIEIGAGVRSHMGLLGPYGTV
jgi:hypothetical protein